jgi:hypothetical protein
MARIGRPAPAWATRLRFEALGQPHRERLASLLAQENHAAFGGDGPQRHFQNRLQQGLRVGFGVQRTDHLVEGAQPSVVTGGFGHLAVSQRAKDRAVQEAPLHRWALDPAGGLKKQQVPTLEGTGGLGRLAKLLQSLADQALRPRRVARRVGLFSQLGGPASALQRALGNRLVK